MIVMKLLVVDIGNTTVNFGLFSATNTGGSLPVRQAGASCGENFKLQKRVKILSSRVPGKNIPFKDFGAAIISSVVPALTSVIVKKIKKLPGARRIIVAGPGNAHIKLKVDLPGQVGADRIVNALAAREIYGSPAVVIDLGTATTFDIVSKKGEYIGGVIAPGVRMSIDALHEKTAKLPRVKLKLPETVIGKNTADAIVSGIVFGNVGMIKEVLKRIKRGKKEEGRGKREEGRIKVILTGGYAELLSKYFPDFAIDPDLTLKGLKIIYEKSV